MILTANRARSKKKRVYLDEVAAQVDAPPGGVYICCFCTEDNLLSQWCGFAEDATGLSIVFNPQQFARYSDQDLSPAGIWKYRLSFSELKHKILYNIDAFDFCKLYMEHGTVTALYARLAEDGNICPM